MLPYHELWLHASANSNSHLSALSLAFRMCWSSAPVPDKSGPQDALNKTIVCPRVFILHLQFNKQNKTTYCWLSLVMLCVYLNSQHSGVKSMNPRVFIQITALIRVVNVLKFIYYWWIALRFLICSPPPKINHHLLTKLVRERVFITAMTQVRTGTRLFCELSMTLHVTING